MPTKSKWGLPARVVVPAVVLLVAPVAYMLVRAVFAARNVAYLDDIDGTLMLLVRLHDGVTGKELFRWLFEMHNEHRMVTSRLMLAGSYWLTGTVNFAFFSLIGNLFLCGLCALLIRTAGSVARQWGMALLLAGLLFQLQHFENFFWSGSSIDHFQVVFLAAVAVVGLARGGWLTFWGAIAFAGLATFTLAHGLMLWPVGAVVLAAARRRRAVVAWVAAGAVAGSVFIADFSFNPAHHIGDWSLGGLVHVLAYWLELLGAPLALGNQAVAVSAGLVLLSLLAWQLKSGEISRERIALPLACWAVAALGLVALGRANLGGGVVSSRYYVLAALAWALGLFVALHRRGADVRSERQFLWLVSGLAVFNLAANVSSAGPARRWLAARDCAVADFVRHGRDGEGEETLHPLPQHATRVIREAERRGVFEMPRQSKELALPDIHPGTHLSSAVDRIVVAGNLVTIDGWAAIAGRASRPGDVQVMLRSGEVRHILTTAGVARPDVAAAFPGEQWRDAGFCFTMRRWLVPADIYELGFLIRNGSATELVMTTQLIDFRGSTFPIKPNRVAPNRVVYDEMLLCESVTSVSAAPKKFMRVAFFDLQGGLVHVDFNGAGTMTIRLADAAPLFPVPRDDGRVVAFMKGGAAISITGADETTNLAVIAARRQPQSFAGSSSPVGFDGQAHVTSISIASQVGRFGAVRAGNAVFSARSGMTGVYAPDVRFSGPVNIGNIRALGDAAPTLELGFARGTHVAGGDLEQPNGQAVRVSGIWRLEFVEGRTSRGELLRARPNLARLEQDGRDVTALIVGRWREAAGAPGDD